MQPVSLQMGHGRTRKFKFAAGIVIMLDAITRLWRVLFDGARPIDRTVLVVDALVLAVIVTEYIHARNRERRMDRREQQKLRRIESLRQAMSQGRNLQHNVPKDISGAAQVILDWRSSVRSWIEETRDLLKSYSAQAETSFLHDPHGIPANYPLAVPEYGQLVRALNNLREIMERPEVYL
jgi:HAMP domain-containing protein